MVITLRFSPLHSGAIASLCSDGQTMFYAIFHQDHGGLCSEFGKAKNA